MQRGWGNWSPFQGELEFLPGAYDGYAADRQCEERPFDYLPELPLVLEFAGRYGGPILDLGCGTGRLAFALAERGYDVYALDLNPAFIVRAQQEAERRSPSVRERVHFGVGDARDFRLNLRFGLILMMDQAFKYLLRHDDHLDCLSCVRAHLKDEGRFLVEHRCLFKLPDAGPGDSYSFVEGGQEWLGTDCYDAVQQVGVSAFQAADDLTATPTLQPIRDFTYAELSLLHRVVGLELDEVTSDLDERQPTTTYFDAALLLKKCEPWRWKRGQTG